jgi:fido (protein-threonine AMPylation protein)
MSSNLEGRGHRRRSRGGVGHNNADGSVARSSQRQRTNQWNRNSATSGGALAQPAPAASSLHSSAPRSTVPSNTSWRRSNSAASQGSARTGNKSKGNSASASKITTGHAGTFLTESSIFLTNDELIGPLPNTTENGSSETFQHLNSIVKFLSQHHSLVSLMNAISSTTQQGDSLAHTDTLAHGSLASSTRPSSESAVGSSSVTIPVYYMPTVESYFGTQMDRQAAGVRTNTNKETSEGMNVVVRAHRQALLDGIAHAQEQLLSNCVVGQSDLLMDSLFTKETLCACHQTVCPNHPQSGRYRTTAAKAGATTFCPPKDIDSQMDLFMSSLTSMQRRFVAANDRNHSRRGRSGSISYDDSMSMDTQTVYDAVAIGALFVWGLTNIHPFADGNGRVSRIGLNCILTKLLGFPFSVVTTATQQQRKEMVEGLKYAEAASRLATARLRHPEYTDPKLHPNGVLTMLSQQSPGSNSTGIPSEGKLRPILGPLIYTFLDRVANAVDNLDRLLQDKARAATVEAEDRIARRARERAAEGSCIICLEEKPNIATLCCGQAVHLNCMAEWLANNETCVSCRGALPRMNVAQSRPTRRSGPRRTAGDYDSDNETEEDPTRPNFSMNGDSAMSAQLLSILQSNLDRIIVNSNGRSSNNDNIGNNNADSEDEDEDDDETDDISTEEAAVSNRGGPHNRETTLDDAHDDDDDDDAHSTAEDETEENHEANNANMNNDDDDDDETTPVEPPANGNNAFVQAPADHDETTHSYDDSDDTEEVVNMQAIMNNNNTNNHVAASANSNGSTSDGNDSTTPNQSATHPSHCDIGHCRNRAAVNCDNNMCGRCCVLVGNYSCPRHRS